MTAAQKLNSLFKWSDGYPSIFNDEYLPQWNKWNKVAGGQPNAFDALRFWHYINQNGLKLLDKPVKIGVKAPTTRVTPDKVYYGYILEVLAEELQSKMRFFQNSSLLSELKVHKTFVNTGQVTGAKCEDGGIVRYVELSLHLVARKPRTSLDQALNNLVGALFQRDVPAALRDKLTKAGASKARPRSILQKCVTIQDKPNSMTSPYGWTQLYYRGVDAFAMRGSDGILIRVYLKIDDPVQIYAKQAHDKVFTEGVRATLRKLK